MEPIINSGKLTKLASLLKSGEINDKSTICIYDKEGKFLARGAWYQDQVLEYSEKFGKAERPWKTSSLMFRLA